MLALWCRKQLLRLFCINQFRYSCLCYQNMIIYHVCVHIRRRTVTFSSHPSLDNPSRLHCLCGFDKPDDPWTSKTLMRALITSRVDYTATQVLPDHQGQQKMKITAKWQKNTAHFCENRKNHGKITAVHIAANLLKTHGFQVQKKMYILGKIINTYYDDVTVTYSTSK